MVMLQDNLDTGAGVALGDEVDTFRCWRCQMTFRIEYPATLAADITKCAIPKCGRVFWHAAQPGMKIRIGVSPQNIVKEFEDETMVRERHLLGVHRDPGDCDGGRDSGD